MTITVFLALLGGFCLTVPLAAILGKLLQRQHRYHPIVSNQIDRRSP